MKITIPANTLDTSNPYVLSKEISTDGNVNIIDVIHPTIAALSVFGPDWIRLLLDPIATYLKSGVWLHNYVIQRYGHL